MNKGGFSWKRLTGITRIKSNIFRRNNRKILKDFLKNVGA